MHIMGGNMLIDVQVLPLSLLWSQFFCTKRKCTCDDGFHVPSCGLTAHDVVILFVSYTIKLYKTCPEVLS